MSVAWSSSCSSSSPWITRGIVSEHELARCVWRGQHVNGRTIDSHVARLHTRLAAAGAHHLLVNKWGQGWSLTTPTPVPANDRARV